MNKPTDKNLAKLFNVSESTLKRWRKDKKKVHCYYAFVDYFNKLNRDGRDVQ